MTRFVYNVTNERDAHTVVSSGVIQATDELDAANLIEFIYPAEEGWIVCVRPAPADYLEP